MAGYKDREKEAAELHIAHIFSHGGVVGVTTSGLELVRALLRNGHRVTLVHRPGAWISKQEFPNGIELVPLDMGVRVLHYCSIRKLYRLLKDRGVEVVHTHGSVADRIGGLMYTFGTIPTLAKAAARILHMHWRFHDIVVAPSQYTANWYIKNGLVSAKKMRVIPNCLEKGEFQLADKTANDGLKSELGLPKEAFVLGSVGGIDKRKNQSAIVPIIHRLIEIGINAHIVLVGRKGQKETTKIQSLATQLGIADHVHLIGHRADARELMRGFDALISTTRDDQVPVALTEGLATGLPIYFSNVGIASEVITNGFNGYVFELAGLESDAGLIDDICDLARSPMRTEKVCVHNRSLFERRFTPDKVVPMFEELYREMAQSS